MAAKEVSNGGRLKSSKIFKRLDMDNDGYITLTDLRQAFDHYKVLNTNADLHALFSALDPEDKGSVEIGQFCRNFTLHQGSFLDALQKPITGVYPEGGVSYGGPLHARQVRDAHETARLESLPRDHPDLPPPPESTSPAPKSPIQLKAELKKQHTADLKEAERKKAEAEQGDKLPSLAAEVTQKLEGVQEEGKPLSDRSVLSGAGRSVIGVDPNEPPRDSLNQTAPMRITDVLRARTSVWKPHKSELYTTLPPGRFSYTIYPDTRHVTQPMIELGRNASFLSNAERFKTTNSVSSIYSVPDYLSPQHQDDMRKNAQREFRVERIARKALNQLNYERRVRMACT